MCTNLSLKIHLITISCVKILSCRIFGVIDMLL
jgi:hypothetical protein